MMLESCFWNFVQNDEKREVDSVIILYLTAFTRMLLADAHCLDMSFPLRDKNGKRLEFEPQNMVCQLLILCLYCISYTFTNLIFKHGIPASRLI